MQYLVILILTALSTIGGSLPSHAESEFKGFYGQVATGYEDNRFSSINPNWRTSDSSGIGPGGSQHKTGAPLVLGGGTFTK